MQRIILALCILGSFNIIAIQCFMAGNMPSLREFLPAQQALMVSAFFIIIIDIYMVFLMMTTGKKGDPKTEFDALYRKYYLSCRNSKEAFDRATKDFQSRL